MSDRLENLLNEMIERGSSDMFLKAGSPPYIRIDGEIISLDYEDLTPEDTLEFARSSMTDNQWRSFEEVPEMDLAIGLSGVGRFRVNVFRQRGTIGMVLRHINNPEFSFQELNLPPVVKQLAEHKRGMTLVTGMTGAGKSTTLAAMINHINETRRCHIVTIEDPIEFLHPDKKAVINQREVGFDTMGFADALKHVLRQSPDVILIGELRDLETIQTALSAAETGHHVLSTLHTTDANQTVERMINYFPAYLHNQVRLELALSLNGIVCQRLLPRRVGKGRVPALEIMINTPTIKKLLMEGRTTQIVEHIQDGEYYGMQTFNQSLLKLIQSNLIEYEVALQYATSPEELRLAYQGMGADKLGTGTF
ncbi:MAG TPA: PilT/PilU family type 4a pilus ATPase [Candidatus Sumerlaeota bacterium]|nr:PilT/PilU family type 4a pilus ATPase [Candidatus Sumerlaeota bacterium]HOR28564.1 PilT/PilU family type 4a pilus ATPase [Candidatus Sumerlaeota bacterium]HPK04034.1 PilT/PilU family type 4a pilus ATPase [Candidatus Sumerlaeota bacterium]